MNYEIIKISLNIINFTITSKNIIDLILDITIDNIGYAAIQHNVKFKITNYLGKGTIGQVYLIERETNTIQSINIFPSKFYVLKISNDNCMDELLNEMVIIKKKFTEYNIINESYPLAHGNFSNIKAIGVIYNFLGYYNLEKIKRINYVIEIPNNKNIIRQIILQMIQMCSNIHCDLKPSNIVIDVDSIENKIKATIIDYGLMKGYNEMNIISTNYITSPESLLTLTNNSLYGVDMSKHDYFGLFVIVINLFVTNNYWDIISNYLIKFHNISSRFIMKDDARSIFVYIWYKFSFNNTIDIPNNKLRKLILDIESKYKILALKKFSNFDLFFHNHIAPNLNSYFENTEECNMLKSFLRVLSHFCPEDRPSLDKLLEHPFLL
jgi:serine/threonine protein kinase